MKNMKITLDDDQIDSLIYQELKRQTHYVKDRTKELKALVEKEPYVKEDLAYNKKLLKALRIVKNHFKVLK